MATETNLDIGEANSALSMAMSIEPAKEGRIKVLAAIFTPVFSLDGFTGRV